LPVLAFQKNPPKTQLSSTGTDNPDIRQLPRKEEAMANPESIEPLGYHIWLRLRDKRVIAPTVSLRREFVRLICQKASNAPLLAFCIADTHVHLEVILNRIASGKLVQVIEIAAKKKLGLKVGFSNPTFNVIKDQNHLKNTFKYILEQAPHHELTDDPFLECTNLPDLLGLRLVGLFTVQHVRANLPRFHRQHLLNFLGVPELPDINVPVHLVTESAAAAMALPDLSGMSRRAIMAKSAAAQVIGNRLAPKELSALLNVHERTLRRMKRNAVDPLLLRAVRLQMVLRYIKREQAKASTTFDAIQAPGGQIQSS
jgi:hypothetical protein